MPGIEFKMDYPLAIFATRTFDVNYAGYDARLVVRLDSHDNPIEVMFLIGQCLSDVKRRVAVATRSCQIISAALRNGMPLKALAAVGVDRLPRDISATMVYGRTKARVANDLSEWVLRHLALTFLSEDECAEIGVHPGFWCPACDMAEAKPSGDNFGCGCGWHYIK